MKRILTAAVLVPVVLGLVLRAPLWLLTLAITLIALLAAREYLDVAAGYKTKPFRLLTYLGVALFCLAPFAAPVVHLPSAYVMSSGLVLFACIATVPFFLLVCSVLRSDPAASLPAAAMSLLGWVYIGFPFFCLLTARRLDGGWFGVLLVLLVVWSGDVFAYYVGRSFGRRPLAPLISPNKTWEGAIASFIGGILVALALFSHANGIAHWAQAAALLPPDPNGTLYPPALAAQICLAATINVAAQLGDLLESMIKRGAGVKDSGTLLPGHGGVLDRVDALLMAAPMAVVVSVLTPLF